MMRAGEAGGILDDILKKLATQIEKQASIRKKIKSASTYPVVIFFCYHHRLLRHDGLCCAKARCDS